MTVLSLEHHDSKRWDKSLCSVHAVPLDSSRGRDEGVIKILQINYTKKKGKLFIYEICTRPSLRRHHLYKLCGGRERERETWLNMRPQAGRPRRPGAPTFIVDLSVPVDVCFSNHFVHLLVGQFLPEVRHHVAELGSADVPVAVL